MINYILIAAIFGYAIFVFYRHIKKSSKGKCGSCELESSCSGTTCSVDWNKVIDEARSKQKSS
ncbi:FeoB-associated Cys-rich membrane protein [Paenisporosarcina cavernae]|nr:FeoB-associated Cys-rich membrane protein [Paenisporosarcina cavernae]